MKWCFVFLICIKVFSVEHYYCVAADEKFYLCLENLIGSIHRYDKNVQEIAVYDLGLSPLQIKKLNRMKYVTINKVELTNVNLLTPIVTSPTGRQVRGCFAWKHAILKQALEKFPYVLYLDASVLVLNNLDHIFSYLKEKGYFFLRLRDDSFHYLENRITHTLIEQVIDCDFLEYKALLLQSDTQMQQASVQGVSKKIYNTYVLPLYKYSKRIELYCDDGTAKLGYGQARHDQTLSSILIHVNGFDMFPLGKIKLQLETQLVNVYCDDGSYREFPHIYLNRTPPIYKGFKHFIQKKR